jgi:hypothetical protein
MKSTLEGLKVLKPYGTPAGLLPGAHAATRIEGSRKRGMEMKIQNVRAERNITHWNFDTSMGLGENLP